MFFLMTSFVGLAVTIFTAKCLFTASMSLAVKIWIFAAILLAWFAPVYVQLGSRFLDDFMTGWLHNIGYYLFGTAFFLFAVLLARNIVWYSAYGFGRLLNRQGIGLIDPDNIALMNKVNLITLIFTFVISLYAVYEGVRMPRIKQVVLMTDKISEPFTFVQLSDVHIHRGVLPGRIERLVRRVNTLHPDLVLLTGDVGDDDADQSADIAQKLGGLKSRYGLFAVMGNHELYRGFRKWEKQFNQIGAEVLYNDGRALPGTNIFIAGVPDVSFARAIKELTPDATKALQKAAPGSYRILMSHSPLRNRESADPDPNSPFDLQISGHTHGGQIFPFHFMVQPVNKYLAGLYPLKQGLLYVSRGTGYWGPPMRLFAPSEITFFRILPLQAKEKTGNQGD